MSLDSYWKSVKSVLSDALFPGWYLDRWEGGEVKLTCELSISERGKPTEQGRSEVSSQSRVNQKAGVRISPRVTCWRLPHGVHRT